MPILAVGGNVQTVAGVKTSGGDMQEQRGLIRRLEKHREGNDAHWQTAHQKEKRQ